MIEKLLPNIPQAEETLYRSVVKTVSYRVVILILDFAAIYLFTGQVKVALGFMVVSNIYTTLGYFFMKGFGIELSGVKYRIKKLTINRL